MSRKAWVVKRADGEYGSGQAYVYAEEEIEALQMGAEWLGVDPSVLRAYSTASYVPDDDELGRRAQQL